MWATTSEVNCGFASSSKKGAFVACQYYKRGNYATATARKKNVQPLKTDQDDVVTPTDESDEDSVINCKYFTSELISNKQ